MARQVPFEIYSGHINGSKCTAGVQGIPCGPRLRRKILARGDRWTESVRGLSRHRDDATRTHRTLYQLNQRIGITQLFIRTASLFIFELDELSGCRR